jgi:glutamine amidotransferase
MGRVRIAIVNYGVGNLRSIQGALLKVGAEPIVTRNHREIWDSDGIILPGVGAFKTAIENLDAEMIIDKISSGSPVLGICLGLQLLFKSSEEGGFVRGLGVLEGSVRRLPSCIKLPHIGWNTLDVLRKSPLLDGVPDGAHFYFAHSFASFDTDSDYCSATSTYGGKFVSIASQGNVFGTQFHPEKSGTVGLTLLKNYVRLAQV